VIAEIARNRRSPRKSRAACYPANRARAAWFKDPADAGRTRLRAIPRDHGDSGDPFGGVTFVIKISEFDKKSAPGLLEVNLCYGGPGE
jgi:hypothetical protein